MKKRALMIYGWIIFSILCQVFVYFLIDKVYLKSRTDLIAGIKTEVVDSNENTEEAKEKKISLTLPKDATNVQVSKDGSYIAFLSENKLNIMEVLSGKVVKVINNVFETKEQNKNKVEGKISCFKWNQEKDMILYAVTSLPNTPVKGQIYSYDLDSEMTHISKNSFSEYSMPRDGDITEILISPLTGAYYARVKVNQTQDRFYLVNIMDEFYPTVYVPTGAKANVGYYSEDLIYTDNTNKLYIKSSNKSATYITMPSKFTLLGVGGNVNETKDTIYTGILNKDGKVEKISYGNNSTQVANWKTIDLDTPVLEENLLIKGNSVYKLNSDNTIVDLVQKSKYTFDGSFIDLTSTFVVSKSDGKVILKEIRK